MVKKHKTNHLFMPQNSDDSIKIDMFFIHFRSKIRIAREIPTMTQADL